MSKLRPTLGHARTGEPSPDTFDALWMIRDSVERRQGLIHGALRDDKGGVCAIGAFFDDNRRLSLDTSLVDEVAAYNDSIPPSVSMRDRRDRMLRWLTARLDYMRARIVPRRGRPVQRKKAS